MRSSGSFSIFLKYFEFKLDLDFEQYVYIVFTSKKKVLMGYKQFFLNSLSFQIVTLVVKLDC